MSNDSLHQAVSALLRKPQRRIDVGPTHYRVWAPCLLRQLEEAVANSNAGSGGRAMPGTKAPLDMGALDLWTEIQVSAGAWAAVLGIDRRRYRNGPRAADEDSIPPVGLLLRAVAADLAGRTDREAMAQAVERNARRWAGQIERMLTPPLDAGRGIVGAPCHGCGTVWVVSIPDPAPGEPDRVVWEPAEDWPTLDRQPAIWVERGETGIIRCLWCRGCGRHTWRDDLAAMAGEQDEQHERPNGEAA